MSAHSTLLSDYRTPELMEQAQAIRLALRECREYPYRGDPGRADMLAMSLDDIEADLEDRGWTWSVRARRYVRIGCPR